MNVGIAIIIGALIITFGPLLLYGAAHGLLYFLDFYQRLMGVLRR